MNGRRSTSAGDALGAHIVPCCVPGHHIDERPRRTTTLGSRPAQEVCADCGREIQRHPDNGRWAHRDAGGVWSFTCRYRARHSRHRGDVVVADYHYVRGEERRHGALPA